MDLSQWVTNPYVGLQKCYCFDRVLTPDDLDSYINRLEEITQLKFRPKLPVEILNGFVTMSYQMGFCPWGNHVATDTHTSVIVSLYGLEKPFGVDAIEHSYQKTEITQELAEQLDKAYHQTV